MTQITLLDGGMGQELIRRSAAAPTPLWSTQVMKDTPSLVTDIHRDFFAAGATVGTSNSYAIHHDRLVGTEAEGDFAALHALAHKALLDAQVPGTRLAGSIGPLSASYRPDAHPAHDVAVPLYAEIAAIHAPVCDLILCETVVSTAHGRAILEATNGLGKPVWIAFSVDDQDGRRLRSGEALQEILPLVSAYEPDAVLLNCSTPEAITSGLPILHDMGVPFGAYANGFVTISDEFKGSKPTVDTLESRKDFTPAAYADHAMGWVDQGATLIGGCCEVSPAHIAEIASRLRAAGHDII